MSHKHDCDNEDNRRRQAADAARDLVRNLLRESDDAAVIVAVAHHNGVSMSFWSFDDMRLVGLCEAVRSAKSTFLPKTTTHWEGEDEPPAPARVTRN